MAARIFFRALQRSLLVSADANQFQIRRTTIYNVVPKRYISHMNMQLISKQTVLPATPPERNFIALSAIEKFIPPVYMPVYLIFSNIPHNSINDFIDRLQKSLSQVLVPYYPFAGRLRMNRTTKSCDIYCDPGKIGVEFNIVSVDEELTKTEFSRPCIELSFLTPKLLEIDAVIQDDGTPVNILSVQVTKFRCGAIALGCSFHHHAADAKAASAFMLAWSELARGKEISVNPSHDRSILEFGQQPDAGYVGQSPVPVSEPRSKLVSGSRDADFVMEGFIFDTEEVNKLKARAPPGSTSFEVTTAFVLRQITKALSVPNAQAVRFAFAADCRRYLPEATNFTGNFVVAKFATIPVDHLLSSGSAAHVVDAIHKAVKSVDLEFFKAYVRQVREQKNLPLDEIPIVVTSMTSFPIYKIDFGYGTADFAGFNPSGLHNVAPLFVLFLPSAKKSGVVVYFQLHKDVLKKVMDDPEFASVARLYRPLHQNPDLNSEFKGRFT